MSQTRPSAKAVTQQIADMFEREQGVPIPRDRIEALGNDQRDPLKRVRRNGGARDLLDAKGIAILWGTRDREAITRLGLGLVGPEEFISYTLKDQDELELLRARGHAELQAPMSLK
jgi:hypothetical protein